MAPRLMKKEVNPEWNGDPTLSVSNSTIPIKLTVYDHNPFSEDDKTGDDEFDIKTFIEALEMNLQGLSSGAVMTRVQRLRRNCLAEESCIVWIEGRVVQDMRLGLRKVECGEVEIQLRWIDLPDSKGL
ncbi:protein C2-DOMAIN ABA-RELATED 4-like [Eucalyptus grandis]|uniref:protein C2-DOMAIN ABA-RELATED 4-like n=1 Tax=Eucalyptus grandis TaxID=71139 RepID=UPI00192EFF3A|nr:protein C2-DOMAIN ABA-RELATED 4-like [Eucalyptus grandis]